MFGMGWTALDQAFVLNLGEFIIDTLKQETEDKFAQIASKGFKFRDEVVGHLMETKAEIELLKSNETKNELTEAIELSAMTITEKCEIMCNQIKQ